MIFSFRFCLAERMASQGPSVLRKPTFKHAGFHLPCSPPHDGTPKQEITAFDAVLDSLLCNHHSCHPLCKCQKWLSILESRQNSRKQHLTLVGLPCCNFLTHRSIWRRAELHDDSTVRLNAFCTWQRPWFDNAFRRTRSKYIGVEFGWLVAELNEACAWHACCTHALCGNGAIQSFKLTQALSCARAPLQTACWHTTDPQSGYLSYTPDI